LVECVALPDSYGGGVPLVIKKTASVTVIAFLRTEEEFATVGMTK
jgi:hypothetical protein